MSLRYTATLYFPAAALKLPPVKGWLEENPNHERWLQDSIVWVTQHGCSEGQIDLTEVLRQFRVPCDHWHECAEGQEGSWTEFNRFKVDGSEVTLAATDQEIEVAAFAGRVRAFLGNDQAAQALELLDEAMDKVPKSIDEESFDPDNDHAKRVLAGVYPELARKTSVQADPLYGDLDAPEWELNQRYSEGHPTFTIPQWQQEVAELDTMDGYWHWVINNITNYFHDKYSEAK